MENSSSEDAKDLFSKSTNKAKDTAKEEGQKPTPVKKRTRKRIKVEAPVVENKKKEAQTAQNEKVKVALEKQERQPLSKPPELEKNAAELTETDSAETPLVAAEVLGAALKSAKAENKAVLVHFTADW